MFDKHGGGGSNPPWKSSLGRLDFPTHGFPKLGKMRKNDQYMQYMLKKGSNYPNEYTGPYLFPTEISHVQLGHPPKAPGADVSPNPAAAWPEVHGCHI